METNDSRAGPPMSDEDLVAYLDGELSTPEAEALEARLALDPVMRSRVESLRKTYELLDYLPQPQPSPTFTSRTLTRLETLTKAASHTRRLWPQGIAWPSGVLPRWGLLLAWLAAAAAALAVGFLSQRLQQQFQQPPDPPALQQVRLLELLPYYQSVDDLDFLRKLNTAGLFPPVPTTPVPAANPNPNPNPNTNATTAAPAQAANITSLISEPLAAADLATLEAAFRNLPVARQRQIRQLDQELHEVEPEERARLIALLERYAVWLDHLPPDCRTEVLQASGADERIQAVQRIKLRQWREQLPAGLRNRVDHSANPDDTNRLIEDYRRQEEELARLWQEARQGWGTRETDRQPFPFNDPALAREVEAYIATVLQPRLPNAEAARLDELRREAEKCSRGLSWYFYGAWIYYLAETHPSLPRPRSGNPVTTVDDLPADFLAKLRLPGTTSKPPPRRDFRELPQHGKWPDFAELIAREAADRGLTLPVPLGPCRPGEFQPEVEAVLQTLLPRLTPAESADLEQLAGTWPAYPAKFIELARKYDLAVPTATLPGSPQLWMKFYSWRRR